MWRAMAAGVSVLLAAVGGVVTVLATAHPSLGLWVALAVLVVVGAVLQAAVTYGERRKRGPVASGAGAVAVGGSAGEIRTQVRGRNAGTGEPGANDGVVASGPGAVSIGGDAKGPVSTDVTGDGDPASP